MNERRGTQAEQLAESWLTCQGLSPVTRNFRGAGGELDLIMREGDTLVMLEVRHRSDARHGNAAESITPGKQQRLMRAAELFLLRHPEQRRLAVRFDVVAFDGELKLPPEWLKDAFRP